MYFFSVDPRNGTSKSGDVCGSCCCESISARPGEVNSVLVSYAAWAAPIGGHGLTNKTVFDIEPVSVSDPLVNNGFGRTVINTVFNGDLSTLFPNPEGEPVEYEILDLYPPAKGVATLGANGQFTYTPTPLFTGIDRFWFSINGNVGEFVIAIDPSAEQPIAQPPFTPAVSVPVTGRKVNPTAYTMNFVLKVSPAAKSGDVYRLTVRQVAIDCDGSEFVHISCYDISIGSCG
ncbi:putative structural protein [Agrobacterium phage OLIVR4]|nr:putative structural protein [Agrobacterium phage OLIVR4]